MEVMEASKSALAAQGVHWPLIGLSMAQVRASVGGLDLA